MGAGGGAEEMREEVDEASPLRRGRRSGRQQADTSYRRQPQATKYGSSIKVHRRSSQTSSILALDILQQRQGGVTIRRQSPLLLKLTHRAAQDLAGPAINFSNIITHFLEARLQFSDLLGRQLAVVNRPGRSQAGPARDRVAEQADAQGIESRIRCSS